MEDTSVNDIPKTQYVQEARLAQLVERKALNLVVVGSSPTVGDYFCFTRNITFVHLEPVSSFVYHRTHGNCNFMGNSQNDSRRHRHTSISIFRLMSRLGNCYLVASTQQLPRQDVYYQG
jgi:hypothetical protein